jgi:hypothetical protein
MRLGFRFPKYNFPCLFLWVEDESKEKESSRRWQATFWPLIFRRYVLPKRRSLTKLQDLQLRRLYVTQQASVGYKPSKKPAEAGGKLLFVPENGGDISLRTKRRYNPDCLTLHSHYRENLIYNYYVISYNNMLYASSQFSFQTSFAAVGGACGSVLRCSILCYKPEGRGLDSRWGHWTFQLTYSFQPHYGPGVDSASNRNEYQESSWGYRAAGE